MNTLLEVGYGFNTSQTKITMVEKVQGQVVDWTLGYLLDQFVNEIPIIGNVQTLLWFMTILYTRWRFVQLSILSNFSISSNFQFFNFVHFSILSKFQFCPIFQFCPTFQFRPLFNLSNSQFCPLLNLSYFKFVQFSIFPSCLARY